MNLFTYFNAVLATVSMSVIKKGCGHETFSSTSTFELVVFNIAFLEMWPSHMLSIVREKENGVNLGSLFDCYS